MPPPLQPPALPVRPGDFHRLGLVTDRPASEVTDWFTTVLGAVPNTGGMPAVRGYPRFGDAPTDGGESGATAEVLWVGPSPIAVFVPVGEDSPLTGFLTRYGPGVHSLAWSVDDLWTVESLLRRHGVRITGTDIDGRHMFMHPRDSAGILIEWTDTEFAEDPRHGSTAAPAGGGGAVPVRGLAYVTAVVRDLDASVGVLGTLMDVGLGASGPGDFADERTADLRIFDLTLRLVSPQSPDGHWGPFLERSGERLASIAWAVDDVTGTEERLRGAGIRVTERAGSVLRTDPADTLGLQMEWARTSQPTQTSQPAQTR